jgi:hypothetical protein
MYECIKSFTSKKNKLYKVYDRISSGEYSSLLTYDERKNFKEEYHSSTSTSETPSFSGSNSNDSFSMPSWDSSSNDSSSSYDSSSSDSGSSYSGGDSGGGGGGSDW